jgi:hypothetical protein
MTVARTHVYYVDLLPRLMQVYAPQAVREQAWRQQAARVRLTGRRRERVILVQRAA